MAMKLKKIAELVGGEVVGDPETLLVVSGSGEVIEPDDGMAAIGSGGSYALAAARAVPILACQQRHPAQPAPVQDVELHFDRGLVGRFAQ